MDFHPKKKKERKKEKKKPVQSKSEIKPRSRRWQRKSNPNTRAKANQTPLPNTTIQRCLSKKKKNPI